MKETTADAEKEVEEGVWKEGGAEGKGRCGEQLSADPQIREFLCPDWYSEMFPAALESL